MPLYEFECEDCGSFVELRSIEQRNQDIVCPHCERLASRMISAPNLALVSPATRKAHQINERSAHAPRVRQSHQCGSGCGCGTKPVDLVGTAKKNANSFGAFKTGRKKSRPWMLGH